MYEIDENIQAYYVHSKPYGSSGGSLKVHIPSLMELIPMGIPKVISTPLNSSCYANSSECKPSVASKINTQNFVTASSPYNDYKHPLYSFGSTIKITAKAEDCLTCRLYPEEDDNSWG